MPRPFPVWNGNNMAVEIRRALPEDARLISETRKVVWEETYRGIYPDEKLDKYDVSYYEQRDREHISNDAEHYYLFLDGKRCVGYFSYGPYHYGSYKDFDLCINHLYILSEYKAIGLGKSAFRQIIEYCHANKIEKFFCGCNANNIPAISFYRHMGGIQGGHADVTLPKEDQIIHFEFYLGD